MQKDRGQVHALNKGLEKATGDVFAFINSDDIYFPGTFDVVMKHFAGAPVFRVVCGDTEMFGEGFETKMIDTVVPKSAAHCLSWAYKARRSQATLEDRTNPTRISGNVELRF